MFSLFSFPAWQLGTLPRRRSLLIPDYGWGKEMRKKKLFKLSLFKTGVKKPGFLKKPGF
jgi:hypothetical protein